MFIVVLLLSLGTVLMGTATFLDDDNDNDETETATEPENNDDNDNEDKDDDDDGVDDDRESETERELKVDHSANEFEIESELKVGETKDEFEVRFKIEDEPEIEFEYKNEMDSLETELELKIEFNSLNEFTDSNGNGYYDANDTVHSSYDLSAVDFEDIQYITSTTSDGELLYEAWTQTTDGVFLLRMYVAGGFGLINGSAITPTEAKIDIEIHSYNFTNQGNLALLLEVKTEVETEIDENDESPDEAEGLASSEEALGFVSPSDYFGFFSWATVATVDGVEKPVVSGPFKLLESDFESDEDESEFEQKGELALVYPNGNDIIHDPKIGVVTDAVYSYIAGEESDTSGIPGFIGITAFVMLTSGALLFFYRRRK
ncbi:MAG: hypothetical protein ACFFB3_02625 [Candidatus Hodarchaeota archaeon]